MTFRTHLTGLIPQRVRNLGYYLLSFISILSLDPVVVHEQSGHEWSCVKCGKLENKKQVWTHISETGHDEFVERKSIVNVHFQLCRRFMGLHVWLSLFSMISIFVLVATINAFIGEGMIYDFFLREVSKKEAEASGRFYFTSGGPSPATFTYSIITPLGFFLLFFIPLIMMVLLAKNNEMEFLKKYSQKIVRDGFLTQSSLHKIPFRGIVGIGERGVKIQGCIVGFYLISLAYLSLRYFLELTIWSGVSFFFELSDKYLHLFFLVCVVALITSMIAVVLFSLLEESQKQEESSQQYNN